MPQFFPDSDDISTENISSTSGEKKDIKGITDNTKDEARADEKAEFTDNTMKDGKGEKNEEITDNTTNDGKGEKITEKKKTDPAAVPTSAVSGKSKKTKVHMEDEKEHSESEHEKDKKDRKLESEGAMPSQNYDLSVKSPKIDPNDAEYSEDNDDPLSLSEIPTSQLDTSVQNSSDEDNIILKNIPMKIKW